MGFRRGVSWEPAELAALLCSEDGGLGPWKRYAGSTNSGHLGGGAIGSGIGGQWTDAPSRETSVQTENKLCRMLPIQSDCRGVRSSRLHCSSFFFFSHTAPIGEPICNHATVAALRGYSHSARPEPRSGEDALPNPRQRPTPRIVRSPLVPVGHESVIPLTTAPSNVKYPSIAPEAATGKAR